MRQELQDNAHDKGSLGSKKRSMTVYCKPYFKDSSGLVGINRASVCVISLGQCISAVTP